MHFFDLQINGYAGVDFNDDQLSPEALHQACDALREDGVEGILATMITDTLPVLCRRLARLAELRESDPLARELIAGIHLEGPFLSQDPDYAGAHPVTAVLQADRDAAKALLDIAHRPLGLLQVAGHLGVLRAAMSLDQLHEPGKRPDQEPPLPSLEPKGPTPVPRPPAAGCGCGGCPTRDCDPRGPAQTSA